MPGWRLRARGVHGCHCVGVRVSGVPLARARVSTVRSQRHLASYGREAGGAWVAQRQPSVHAKCFM